MRRIAFLLAMLITPAIGTAMAQDKPKNNSAKKAEVIPANQAKNHLGKTITTELTVKSSKKAESSKRYYLDSEADYKSDENLAVIISFDTAKEFEKEGVKDIIAYYENVKIRVTGKVVHESDQTRIHVTKPDQIKLVEKK